MATDTTDKKPRLQVCLEQLEELVAELRHVSDQYVAMKNLFQQLFVADTLPEGTDLLLRLPPNGQEVPLGLPSNPDTWKEMLNVSTSGYGEQVLDKWLAINELVAGAAQHCSQIKSQATS